MAPTTRKRKASADLSTNPHTTKARNRITKMEGYELQIELAKNADRSAIAYALKKLQKTKKWIAADLDTQATMKEDSYNAIVHKRTVDKKHWTVLAKELGIDGRYAQDDDGNPAWEDVEGVDEDEEDAEAEARWRANDINNGEIIPEEDNMVSKEAMVKKNARAIMDIEFRRWQRYWLVALSSLKRKLQALNRKGIAVLEELSPGFDTRSRTIYDLISPHLYFTSREIAMWRNMSSWAMPKDMVNITLPGPAEFWPEDYDFEKHGFYIDDKNKDNYQEAYGMVFADGEPERYCLIFPSGMELRVMDDTAEARIIQKMML